MLDAIVDNRKKNCFQKSDGAFCGNKIVEVGEECDCGFDDAECQETCCYPRLVLSHLRKLLGCKLACGRVRVRAPQITNFLVMCVWVGAKIVGLTMPNAKKNVVIQG